MENRDEGLRKAMEKLAEILWDSGVGSSMMVSNAINKVLQEMKEEENAAEGSDRRGA